MIDRSTEPMDEIAEHVEKFRSHESYVQYACRKLSDAASVLTSADFASTNPEGFLRA